MEPARDKQDVIYKKSLKVLQNLVLYDIFSSFEKNCLQIF